jgi:cation:H+ antiporter
MLIQIVLIIFGFVVLIIAADWLITGSVSLARYYRISELTIGLTIVAFGTSTPELVVNIISSIKGYNDVTLGNIVGSNIFNLMLILGLSGMVFPLTVKSKTIWNEIPFSLIAAIVLILIANFTFKKNSGPSLNRIDGGILLLFFLIFMVYIFRNMKEKEQKLYIDYRQYKPAHSLLLIAGGLIALVISSRLVVFSSVKVAGQLGISQKLIGITIISAGTSLPELVTSVVAAFRHKSDIAVGNIIGSNIFNIFFILGISASIAPVPYNPSFNFDILLLIISTILLFAFMFSGKKYRLDRWEAMLLTIAYISYLYYLIYNAR